MILNVIFVTKIELLWVQLNSMALIGRVISTILQQSLKVLSTECNKLFGLRPHDLLDEVLEDAGECIGYLDLLGSENSHLAHV